MQQCLRRTFSNRLVLYRFLLYSAHLEVILPCSNSKNTFLGLDRIIYSSQVKSFLLTRTFSTTFFFEVHHLQVETLFNVCVPTTSYRVRNQLEIQFCQKLFAITLCSSTAYRYVKALGRMAKILKDRHALQNKKQKEKFKENLKKCSWQNIRLQYFIVILVGNQIMRNGFFLWSVSKAI